MQVEELVDLLAIADRYDRFGGPFLVTSRSCSTTVRFEASTLSSLCETELIARVACSNVFPLLEVADHYSARKLRVSAYRRRQAQHAFPGLPPCIFGLARGGCSLVPRT